MDVSRVLRRGPGRPLRNQSVSHGGQMSQYSERAGLRVTRCQSYLLALAVRLSAARRREARASQPASATRVLLGATAGFAPYAERTHTN